MPRNLKWSRTLQANQPSVLKWRFRKVKIKWWVGRNGSLQWYWHWWWQCQSEWGAREGWWGTSGSSPYLNWQILMPGKRRCTGEHYCILIIEPHLQTDNCTVQIYVLHFNTTRQNYVVRKKSGFSNLSVKSKQSRWWISQADGLTACHLFSFTIFRRPATFLIIASKIVRPSSIYQVPSSV